MRLSRSADNVFRSAARMQSFGATAAGRPATCREGATSRARPVLEGAEPPCRRTDVALGAAAWSEGDSRFGSSSGRPLLLFRRLPFALDLAGGHTCLPPIPRNCSSWRAGIAPNLFFLGFDCRGGGMSASCRLNRVTTQRLGELERGRYDGQFNSAYYFFFLADS